MLRFPHNRYSGLRTSQYREQESLLVEARINGGQVTSIDAADIENNQFTDIKNMVVRYDKTSRRFGSIVFTPAKPDSNPVLAITTLKRFDKSVFVVRATASTLEFGTTGSWTPVVGTLSGDDNDKFNFLVVNNDLYFSNNGADEIQKVDFDALTFAQAGDAPRYKYITSFNNRIVGANLADDISPSPIQIGWSGNLAFEEWDASVDQSAGFTLLVDSPTDFSDDITGIFGFTEAGLILRERSLWGMNKAPVATNPFIFFIIAPEIGCDCPFSAVSIRNGICWFDFRTGTVYAYKVGMQEPEAIGRPVEKSIQASVSDKDTIFASYNPIEDEYTLCIPHSTSSEVTMWTYNFRTKAWWNEAQSNVTALSAIDYNSGSLVINDLVGTIDDLIGVIDDLSSNISVPSRFYGKLDGDILIESKANDQDNDVNFTTQLTSKVYFIPKHDHYVQTLRIEFIPRLAGSFILYYSKDGGETWNTYKTVSWTNDDIGVRKLTTFKKHLKTGKYAWRLEATGGLFDLTEYEISTVTSSADTKSV